MTDYERECMRKTRGLLSRWGCAMLEIRRMERRSRMLLDLLRDIAPTLKAQCLTGMPHGSGTSDPVTRAVEQMEQRRAEYQGELDAIDREIRQRRAEQESVDELMQRCLTDLQIQIIDLRFREGRTFDYIAGRLNYSEIGVKKQEFKAVSKLSRRIE
jgi:DNA-binding NarL/FixJ family response regulator